MNAMTPAAEDLKTRKPVWEALSTLFLDTDVSLFREWRAEKLAESAYSIEEIEEILRDEVFPVCSWNRFGVAGEWAGFDPDWLQERILRRSRRRFRWRLGFGHLLITRSKEWRRTKELVLGLKGRGAGRQIPELIQGALEDHSSFKQVYFELERRRPSRAGAELLIEAHRRGDAPDYLAAALLGQCRHAIGYQTVRNILLSAPGYLAESYAGVALAKIAGQECLEDLIDIQQSAPHLKSREGAAYGLANLGSPEAMRAVLDATLLRKIRWHTGARILGRASPDEELLLDLLGDEDEFRTRLATEIAWACILSDRADPATESPRLVTHPSEALIEALREALAGLSMSTRKRKGLYEWLDSKTGASRVSS